MTLLLVLIGLTFQSFVSWLFFRWLLDEMATDRQELAKLRTSTQDLTDACRRLWAALATPPVVPPTTRSDSVSVEDAKTERLREFLTEQYQPGGRWPMREHSTWQPRVFQDATREPIKE